MPPLDPKLIFLRYTDTVSEYSPHVNRFMKIALVSFNKLSYSPAAKSPGVLALPAEKYPLNLYWLMPAEGV